MHGFSEEDAPLSIGYYLGLRWFQAYRVQHSDWTVSQQHGGGLVTMTCGCGERSQAPRLSDLDGWYETHSATASGVVLNGSRGRWDPGVNQAECGAAYDHRVPDRECGCGFWAYWQLGIPQTCEPAVPALVRGSGKIIKGPRGFRCGQASIVALVAPERLADIRLAAEAAEAHNIPLYPSVKELLDDFQAPGTQPPLGDDYYTSQAGQRRRVTGSFGFIATSGSNTIVHHGGAGGAGGAYSSSSGGYSSSGGGSVNPGGTGSVHAALTAGVQPCQTCGKLACAPGQANCAVCQIAMAALKAKVKVKLAQVEKNRAAQATTGIDALKQLADRRAKWDQEQTPLMGPPDPPGWANGIGADGRRNPPGYQVRRMLDWIRARYGCP